MTFVGGCVVEDNVDAAEKNKASSYKFQTHKINGLAMTRVIMQEMIFMCIFIGYCSRENMVSEVRVVDSGLTTVAATYAWTTNKHFQK